MPFASVVVGVVMVTLTQVPRQTHQAGMVVHPAPTLIELRVVWRFYAVRVEVVTYD